MNVEKHAESMRWLAKVKALDFRGLSRFSLIDEEPKGSIYITCDENAERALEEFTELLTRFAREWGKTALNLNRILELKAHIRKARSELENYMVEAYRNEPRLKNLKPIMNGLDTLVVPREAIYTYYNPETGIITAKENQPRTGTNSTTS